MRGNIQAEVIIVGGGLAGLSAAVYLARAKRDVLIIDGGKSMARWEPDVQNFLGFPEGIDGNDLIRRGRRHARRFHARFSQDVVIRGQRSGTRFLLRGRAKRYCCRRLLIATGIFHIPPEIPGLDHCLGHSMFFCKDCDGYRVQGKVVGIYGNNDDAVEYALGILLFSPKVMLLTGGRAPKWSRKHAMWLKEYKIPVFLQCIHDVEREGRQIRTIHMGDGTCVALDALFTVRGDVYYNELARGLGARLDPQGQVVVNAEMQTNVPGLYSAGCITPANCQMIVAAGQGAVAAQAINRNLFEESLQRHSLRRLRRRQLRHRRTQPAVRKAQGSKPTITLSA